MSLDTTGQRFFFEVMPVSPSTYLSGPVTVHHLCLEGQLVSRVILYNWFAFLPKGKCKREKKYKNVKVG